MSTCGVKFSAVRLSSLINVRVINAALHYFDIYADQYAENVQSRTLK